MTSRHLRRHRRVRTVPGSTAGNLAVAAHLILARRASPDITVTPRIIDNCAATVMRPDLGSSRTRATAAPLGFEAREVHRVRRDLDARTEPGVVSTGEGTTLHSEAAGGAGVDTHAVVVEGVHNPPAVPARVG